MQPGTVNVICFATFFKGGDFMRESRAQGCNVILVTKEKLPAREEMLNDLLSLMACHAAVRAGDRLTPEEIAALVRQRARADHSHHCPHGRPTSLLFTLHDLERQFRRV